MTPSPRHHALALLIAFCFLAGASPAEATTYVVPDDGALADQAALIVDGRIEAAARAADAPDAATEYTVAVNLAVKGTVTGGAVTVRVLGGLPRDDGPWLHAWGAPRFRLGERVLLFLAPRGKERFAPVQLGLGAFRSVPHEGGHLAFRPEVAAFAVAGQEERVRDYDAFVGWLAARSEGKAAAAEYFVAPPAGGLGGIAERFELLEHQGRNFRWFEFDYGVSVDFRADAAGQPGMTGGGFGEFETALWRWNHDPDSTVELRYRGTTRAATPLYRCDGLSSVVFDDPGNEIGGSFDCSSGGVLAVAGICTRGTDRYQGKEYWTSTEGVILTQDGAGCVFGVAGGNVGEHIFAHEIGHTLGFGHSCGAGTRDRDCTNPANAAAVMAWRVTDRARQGAILGDDDRAALAALYPAGGGGDEVDPDGWLATSEIPGFRFRVNLVPPGAAGPIRGVKEDRCLAETLCVSGALPGRVEVELRVVGPRPNGKLWPTFVKFTTSRVEIEVEQIASGETRDYVLDEAGPGNDVLNGLFDRAGFEP